MWAAILPELIKGLVGAGASAGFSSLFGGGGGGSQTSPVMPPPMEEPNILNSLFQMMQNKKGF